MDNFQTQDVLDQVDGDICSDDEPSSVWGRLYPLGSSFSSIDLTKEEYLFGRGEDCDFSFNSSPIRRHDCFQAYSKVHFKLYRQDTKTGKHTFIEDRSSNGTFLNGEKIGKGKVHLLSNNDEIALALKKNKAFVYIDLEMKDTGDLPKEVSDNYTVTKLLGRGACGEVKLAFRKGSCHKFAIKIIAKKTFSMGPKPSNMVNIMNEVEILKAMKHPCIICVEDVMETVDNLYIILELVEGGELFDRVVSSGKLTEAISKLYFYQMASAIKYLHDEGVTHRDLKPENILLCSDEMETLVKVTDFGLSRFIDAGSIMKTFCGTPSYLAPEILLTQGTGSYTEAIDVWSIGVILYICLVGYPPFASDRTDMDLMKQITGAHYSFPECYWKGISHEAKDLISKMLIADPKKRLSITQVLEHPWLQDDKMMKVANGLMYPGNDQMKPPTLPVGRKRNIETTDAFVDVKCKATTDDAERCCESEDNDH